MAQLIQMFLFDAPAGPIALATTLYLVGGMLVGRTLRRPMFEGAALGFLLILASTDMAYYLVRYTHLPLMVFAVAAVVILVLLILTLRLMQFMPPAAEPARWWTVAIPVVAIWPAAWLTNIVMPDPSAGYAIFQAWNPLYLNASTAAGKFLLETDVRFGDGILMQTLYYAADIFGPAAWLSYVFGVDANAALYGAHISAVLLALGVLSAALGNRLFAQIVFVALTLIFFRWGHAYRTVMGDNWGDNTLFLAGALTCFYLARAARGQDTLPAAAFAAGFLVFGRNFGAFYFAVFGLLFFAADYFKHRMARFPLWLGVGALGTLFASKELLQAVILGPYYPVAAHTAFEGLSFTDRIQVIAADLGIVANGHIFGLPMPAALMSALMCIVILVARRQGRPLDISPARLALPLVMILPPVLLELGTGYRSPAVASKLYIVVIFLLSWYPAFLASALAGSPRARTVVPRTKLAGALSLLVLVLAAGSLLDGRLDARGGAATYAMGAFESYRDNNTDLRIAGLIALRGPDFARTIRERPILYMHYEPGIGLRYYLGGDITRDLDFWSTPVQAKIGAASTFPEAMKALDWPNISIGHPGYASTLRKAAYPEWAKFEADLTDLTKQPWVSEVMAYRDSAFIITRPIASSGQ